MSSLLDKTKRKARHKWLTRHFETAIHENYLFPPFKNNRAGLQAWAGLLEYFDAAFPEWISTIQASMADNNTIVSQINLFIQYLLEYEISTDLALTKTDQIKTEVWYERIRNQSDLGLHRQLCLEVLQFLVEPKQRKLLYEMYLSALVEVMCQDSVRYVLANATNSTEDRGGAYAEIIRFLIWHIVMTPWQELYLLHSRK